MTDTPTETPQNRRLEDAIVAFTRCIAQAVPDICSYGWTVGEAYVPFNPDENEDCPEDIVQCEQLWVRVENVVPVTINEGGFGGDTCAVDLRVNLEVGIMRCFVIPEEGEAPTTSEVLGGALLSMSDMRAIMCAALTCKRPATEWEQGDAEGMVDIWESIELGTWVPLGPLGGQYGGVWTFTVEL